MNGTCQDTGNLAEQLGAGIAMGCLNSLLATQSEPQGERIGIVMNALAQLNATTHPDRAAAGFACIVENVLSRGMGVPA